MDVEHSVAARLNREQAYRSRRRPDKADLLLWAIILVMLGALAWAVFFQR